MAIDKKSPKYKKIKTIVNIAIFIACIVIAYLLATFMFATVPVKGASMEPTLHSEDTILLFKPGKYRFGDVVVFKTNIIDENSQENRHFVKRIIGMPGDVIEFKMTADGARVFRNGAALKEDYVNENVHVSYNYTVSKVIVPENEFFYLGDNRNFSSDSGTTGDTAELKSIVGRVVLRYKKNILNNPTTIKRIKSYMALEDYSLQRGLSLSKIS